MNYSEKIFNQANQEQSKPFKDIIDLYEANRTQDNDGYSWEISKGDFTLKMFGRDLDEVKIKILTKNEEVIYLTLNKSPDDNTVMRFIMPEETAKLLDLISRILN